jgi:hypothetical protein
MRILLLALSLSLVGCASYPAVSQPRALGIGAMQPTCVFFCFQTATFTDAEAGSNQTSSNSNSQSGTIAVGDK